MPASSQFVAFATGGGANVETPTTWAADSILANGFSSGLAPSNKVNTAIRQPSFVAAAFAAWLATQGSQAVNDDGVLANFEANISAGLAGYLAAAGYATTSGVGSVYATLASFANSLTTAGYQKMSGSLILQWKTFTATVGSSSTYSFPATFPTACLFCNGTYKDTSSTANGGSVFDATSISTSQFQTWWASNYNTGGSGDGANVKVWALGY